MADLGTLPSTNILAKSPGSSANSRRGGFSGGWGRPGTTQQNTQQQGGAPPQPQTFAQMQQAGLARPAPPPNNAPQAQQQSYQGSAQSAGPSSFQGPQAAPRTASAAQYGAAPQAMQYSAPQQPANVSNQYNQSVSNALAAPSRYDLPQVQQVQQALTAQLNQQYGAQAKQLDEQMAQRGLSASSIGAGYQGDLRSAQATALANMNAQLIQGQAATSAGDLAASLSAGSNWQSQQNQAGQFGQSLAQQQLENQQQFGLSQGQLTGQYNGQQTLGGAQQALAAQLGIGNLNLGQQQVANQANQFGQTFGQQQLENSQQYGLAQQQQALAQQLGLGNLSNSQQQTANQYALGQGQLAQGQQQISNQANQFGQTFGQQQFENSQQYGLAQQQAALAQQLGLGNLGVAQQQANTGATQVANQNTQFGQSQAQQNAQFNAAQGQQNAQFGQSQLQQNTQFGKTLDQQMAEMAQQNKQFNAAQGNQVDIANMQDVTANRGVDVQNQQAISDYNKFLAQWLSSQGYKGVGTTGLTGADPNTAGSGVHYGGGTGTHEAL